jgi:hypothetical protein
MTADTFDPAVAAAEHWLDLALAGDWKAAWRLTHPDLQHLAVAAWLEANPLVVALLADLDVSQAPRATWEAFAGELRWTEDVAAWNWFPQAKPLTVGREVAWLMNPAATDALFAALDGDEAVEDPDVKLLGFVMQHTPDGWLYCGQSRPNPTEATPMQDTDQQPEAAADGGEGEDTPQASRWENGTLTTPLILPIRAEDDPEGGQAA